MNRLDQEAQDALAEIYEGDFGESVAIDGLTVFGSPVRPLSEVELVDGGWENKVTHTFSSLKKYWPTGNYPKRGKSSLTYTACGRVNKLQIVQVNGDRDNGAQITFGLGNFNSAK